MCTFTLNIRIYNLFYYNFSTHLKTCLHLGYVAGSNLTIFSEVPKLFKHFILGYNVKRLLNYLKQVQDFYFLQDAIINLYYLNSTERRCVPLVFRHEAHEFLFFRKEPFRKWKNHFQMEIERISILSQCDYV